jgi:hypothetical protein
MKNVTVDGYTRLNKTMARKYYRAGYTIRLVPLDISPTSGLECDVGLDWDENGNIVRDSAPDFDAIVKQWKVDNGPLGYIGRYPQFYINYTNEAQKTRKRGIMS